MYFVLCIFNFVFINCIFMTHPQKRKLLHQMTPDDTHTNYQLLLSSSLNHCLVFSYLYLYFEFCIRQIFFFSLYSTRVFAAFSSARWAQISLGASGLMYGGLKALGRNFCYPPTHRIRVLSGFLDVLIDIVGIILLDNASRIKSL